MCVCVCVCYEYSVLIAVAACPSLFVLSDFFSSAVKHSSALQWVEYSRMTVLHFQFYSMCMPIYVLLLLRCMITSDAFFQLSRWMPHPCRWDSDYGLAWCIVACLPICLPILRWRVSQVSWSYSGDTWCMEWYRCVICRWSFLSYSCYSSRHHIVAVIPYIMVH